MKGMQEVNKPKTLPNTMPPSPPEHVGYPLPPKQKKPNIAGSGRNRGTTPS